MEKVFKDFFVGVLLGEMIDVLKEILLLLYLLKKYSII